MRLWKVLACLDVGILLSIIGCVMAIIWNDDPAIDEKLDNTIGVLIILGLGLAFLVDWDEMKACRGGRRDSR